ncbi:hypothetical protein [Phyllobacterium sp. OV277]|uniref:hypothetical protein n=1 Tax=Phyllobacterium sp. OV277 TaxID=1882772 RepID=UPI00087F8469|nr:hypothetical protein [Phyllobacterium sp. OV277]SDO79253.1 hypothetical protein SAMN05443582_1021079 [Phyllobacterium sp. OV277]
MTEFSWQFVLIVWEHPYIFMSLVVIFQLVVSFSLLMMWRIEMLPMRGENPETTMRVSDVAMLTAIVLAAGFFIQFRESFTWWDANIFFTTVSPTSYQWYAPPIWPTGGRFFPLAHQEFHFLGKLSKTMEFYRLFSTVEFAVVCLLSWWILKPSKAAPLLWFAILCSTPIASSFIDLIYPERNIAPLSTIIICAVFIFIRSGGWLSAAVASLGVSLIVFYKETSIILPSSLAFCCFAKAVCADHKYKNRLIVACLMTAIPVVVWLSLYAILIIPHITDRYHSTSTFIDALVYQLESPWIYLCLGASTYRIMTGKIFDPVFDALPLAVLGHILALVLLQFDMPYYSASIALLSIFYVFWTFSERTKLLSLIVAALIIWQAPITWKDISDKKQLTYAKSQAADFLLSKIRDGAVIHIFGSAYEAGLFGGYLKAKSGIALEIVVHTNKWMGGDCSPDIKIYCHPPRDIKGGEYLLGLSEKPILSDGDNLVFETQPAPEFSGNHKMKVYQRI